MLSLGGYTRSRGRGEGGGGGGGRGGGGNWPCPPPNPISSQARGGGGGLQGLVWPTALHRKPKLAAAFAPTLYRVLKGGGFKWGMSPKTSSP